MPHQIIIRALSETTVKDALARHARALVGARVSFHAQLLSVVPSIDKPDQGAALVQELADADADAQHELRRAAAAAEPEPAPPAARPAPAPHPADVNTPAPPGRAGLPWPRRAEDVPDVLPDDVAPLTTEKLAAAHAARPKRRNPR